MKARLVYESLDFERGMDPKKSMGLGRKFKKGDLVKVPFPHTTNRLAVSDDGSEICMIYDIVEKDSETYIEVFIGGKHILVRADQPGVKLVRPVDESLNFERGKDPKKSMNVGLASIPVNPVSKFAEITYPLVVDQMLTDEDQVIFTIKGREFLDNDKNTYYFAISSKIAALVEMGKVGLVLWRIKNSKGAEIPFKRLEHIIDWDTNMNQAIKDLWDIVLNDI